MKLHIIPYIIGILLFVVSLYIHTTSIKYTLVIIAVVGIFVSAFMKARTQNKANDKK